MDSCIEIHWNSADCRLSPHTCKHTNSWTCSPSRNRRYVKVCFRFRRCFLKSWAGFSQHPSWQTNHRRPLMDTDRSNITSWRWFRVWRLLIWIQTYSVHWTRKTLQLFIKFYVVTNLHLVSWCFVCFGFLYRRDITVWHVYLNGSHR